MQKKFDVYVTLQAGKRSIFATSNGIVIRSDVLESEIENIGDLALWLLSQEGESITVTESLQKRLTVDYHEDELTDPETNLPYTQFVVDQVATVPLPEDAARNEFVDIPGFSTWSASEAEAWINENVSDISSIRSVLSTMAKAVVQLRRLAIE